MGAPTESEEKREAVRARLWSELARGRAGSVTRVMGSIQTESRPDDGVVIDRLMLAPESASEGTEHAVPVAIVRPHGDWDDKLPVVAFLHGTGGDTEGLMPSLIAMAAWPLLREPARTHVREVRCGGGGLTRRVRGV